MEEPRGPMIRHHGIGWILDVMKWRSVDQSGDLAKLDLVIDVLIYLVIGTGEFER
jgi:hypothetical protein